MRGAYISMRTAHYYSTPRTIARAHIVGARTLYTAVRAAVYGGAIPLGMCYAHAMPTGMATAVLLYTMTAATTPMCTDTVLAVTMPY